MGSIKIVVDLFKEVLDILGRPAKHRRDSFDNIFKPLYERLAPIVTDYYCIIDSAREQLESEHPDFAVVIRDIESARAKLAIARSGIIGEARAFADRHGYFLDNPPNRKPRVDKLINKFSNSIIEYFMCTSSIGGYDRNRPSSFASMLAEALREQDIELMESVADNAQLFDEMKGLFKDTLIELEKKWAVLSENYAALHLYCTQ